MINRKDVLPQDRKETLKQLRRGRGTSRTDATTNRYQTIIEHDYDDLAMIILTQFPVSGYHGRKSDFLPTNTPG